MRSLWLTPAFALFGLTLASPVMADDDHPHHWQDQVVYQTSAESWVSTKTAKVTVGIEAGGLSEDSGETREAIQKAVAELAPKADWHMTFYNHSLDNSNIDRWSATFGARLTESDLAGLDERAKKLSRPGMKITIEDREFSPSLAEIEDAKIALRQQLYAMAAAELTRVNAALPGRSYRIATISFEDNGAAPAPMPPRMIPHMVSMMATASGENGASSASGSAPGAQVSMRLVQTMDVTFAAQPPVTAK